MGFGPVRERGRLVEWLGLSALLGRYEAQGEADPGSQSGSSGGWSTRRGALAAEEQGRGAHDNDGGDAPAWLGAAGSGVAAGWGGPVAETHR